MADCEELAKQEMVAVIKEHFQTIAKNRQLYDSNKVNIQELAEQGKRDAWPIEQLETFVPGITLTPRQVAAAAAPVRELGTSIVEGVPLATEQFINGSYRGLWKSLMEFTFMAKIGSFYDFPKQTAGQVLKAFDDPTLLSTLFLKDVATFASWFAKKKLEHPAEIEAHGAEILKAMSVIKTPEQYANIAKKVVDHGEDALKDPTFGDKARFLFINSLMSSFDTMGRNFQGSLMMAAHVFPTHLIRPATSRIANLFLPESKKLYEGSLMETAQGFEAWGKAMWDASRYSLKGDWQALAKMGQSGETTLELAFNRYDLQRFRNTGTTNPFSGLTGKVIGWPVGLAQGVDNIFQVAAFRYRAVSRLYPDWLASNSNLTWGQYREEQLANLRPDLFDDAFNFSKYLTFKDNPTAFTKALMGFREKTGFMGSHYFLPFLQTPDRIVATGYNFSPLLSIVSTRFRDEMASPDALVRADSFARVAWAHLVATGLWVGARNGFLTGGGEVDRALAKQERQTKARVDYALRLPDWLGGGYFPTRNITPGGQVLGVIADVAEKWEFFKDNIDRLQAWTSIGLMTARTMFDQPMTQQASAFVSIWDSPSSLSPFERVAQQVIQTGKAALIPNYRLVAQIGQAVDPVIKEADGIQAMLTKDIPFMGGRGLRNPVTGDLLTAPERLFPVFGPTAPIQTTDSPGILKAKELGVKWPTFPRSPYGTAESENIFKYASPMGAYKKAKDLPRLTDADYDEWIRLSLQEPDDAGRRFNERLDELVQSGEFSQMTEPEQAAEMINLYHEFKGLGLEKFEATEPGKLYLEAVELKQEQAAPILEGRSLEIRQQAEQDFEARRTEEVEPFVPPSLEMENP